MGLGNGPRWSRASSSTNRRVAEAVTERSTTGVESRLYLNMAIDPMRLSRKKRRNPGAGGDLSTTGSPFVDDAPATLKPRCSRFKFEAGSTWGEILGQTRWVLSRLDTAPCLINLGLAASHYRPVSEASRTKERLGSLSGWVASEQPPGCC